MESQAQGQAKPRHSRAHAYRYTKIQDIKSGSVVNVYGVVKYFKPPAKSRGSDHFMKITIIDNSGNQDQVDQTASELRCLLFMRSENLFPRIEVGDIIRFHRVRVTEFNDSLQGQTSPGFSWLVFSGDLNDAPVAPSSASSTTFTLTDFDRSQVEELRQWANHASGEIAKENNPTTSIEQNTDEKSTEASQQQPNNMTKQTATIAEGLVNTPRTTLKEIKCQAPPKEFKVRAQVLDFVPKLAKAATAKQFLHLYCERCHYVVPMRDVSVTRDHLYPCVTCRDGKKPALLEIIYMMRFVLYDESDDFIVVQLWKEQAIKFLNNTPTQDLLRDASVYTDLSASLQKLCPPLAASSGDRARPWAELCIKSYKTPRETCYQIFDSVLNI